MVRQGPEAAADDAFHHQRLYPGSGECIQHPVKFHGLLGLEHHLADGMTLPLEKSGQCPDFRQAADRFKDQGKDLLLLGQGKEGIPVLRGKAGIFRQKFVFQGAGQTAQEKALDPVHRSTAPFRHFSIVYHGIGEASTEKY